MSNKTTPLKFADNVTNLPPDLPAEPQPFALSVPASTTHPSTHLSPALSQSPNAPAVPQPALAPSAPSTSAVPDRFLQLKIESLKAKQRADSFFNSLNSRQVSKLATWLIEIDNLMELHNRVKAPPPEGLGIDVNLSTLSRLRDAWRADEVSLGAQSLLNIIIDAEEQTDFTQIPRIQGIMNHILHESTFELMRKHPASPLLPELLAHIQKLTDLDLRRQKLQLEREKLLLKSPASVAQPKHHRIDLNIVPPARNQVTTTTP